MKNILLIEPKYQYTGNHTVPLSFQKIATYHITKGDNVIYTNNEPTRRLYQLFENKKIDIVYITSMFTYDLQKIVQIVKKLKTVFRDTGVEIKIGGIAATLMPKYIEKHTGIKPHKGLWFEIEDMLPNYDIFPKTKTAILFTTRGCIRKCGFCAVKKLEPNFEIVKMWKEQISNVYYHGIENCHLQDNNFLAAPFEHQEEVVNYLVNDLENKITIDFNQALDCRLFKNKHARMLVKVRLKNWRFAFDNMEEDGYFQRAVRKIHRYSYQKKQNISVLMLYGFNDTIDDLWYRMNEMERLQKKFDSFNFTYYPMRYQSLNSLDKNNFVGKHWTKKELKCFKSIQNNVSRFGAMIPLSEFKTNFGRVSTRQMIGDSPEEFKENLNKKLIINNGEFKFVGSKTKNINKFI